ncbi:MAG: hypothetical protein HYY20_10185, partial [Candidatus Tectomicrobia bacterium]|nr:hypothetical protein [Candidatus Tectomicrobia bacterium]
MKGRLLSLISLGLTGTVLALGGCESLANAKKKQEGPQSYAPRPSLQPKEELQPKEGLQVYVPRLAAQEISPLLLRAGLNGEAKPVRALSLEAILEELKVDLIRHRYGQLVERVDEQLFPYRQLEQKLGELTGISFRDKPLPRLKVHRFNGEGEAWDGPEEVAALYRREENTIYFDPSILIEREKEAIYHEFFHSKGHFVSPELNEGWVEYLTVLATGLPPARYGMRAFNVHNLVFLLG